MHRGLSKLLTFFIPLLRYLQLLRPSTVCQMSSWHSSHHKHVQSFSQIFRPIMTISGSSYTDFIPEMALTIRAVRAVVLRDPYSCHLQACPRLSWTTCKQTMTVCSQSDAEDRFTYWTSKDWTPNDRTSKDSTTNDCMSMTECRIGHNVK